MGGEDSELGEELPLVLAGCIDDFVRVTAIERLSGGASQQTHRIVVETADGERMLALRRGSATSALQDALPLATEAELMRVTAERGAPAPHVVHVLEPGHALGDGFLMDWVDGETIGPRITQHERFAAVRPRLATQCGEILARIHLTDLEATGLARRLETVDPGSLVGRTWNEYRDLATPEPVIDFAGRWLSDHLPATEPGRLVHGDFRNGNLVVHPESGVVAVLDWELAHIGDPLRDVGWICCGFWRYGRPELPVGGFGRIEDLVSAYERESGEPVDLDRLRFWEVFGCFWWAVTCLRMADTYRAGADTSVERPAIGRRSTEAQIDCVNLLIPGPTTPATGIAGSDPEPEPTDDSPAATETLVSSVARYLREEVVAEAEGRQRFLARVAANSLDIAGRELTLGPAARRAEHERLSALLGERTDLVTLRTRLCERLRGGRIALDDPELCAHLRSTTIDRVAIDQPDYHGLSSALSFHR
jgi:aminoglycoside phosphotransferase (APT) family kinase protein